MERKKSFILYCDYQQHINLLTLEEKGMLLECIFEYSNTGEMIEVSGTVRMAFSFIKSQLDRDREKYAEKCSVNKENGAKGGRPPKPKETETNPDKPNGFSNNRSKAKKPDNDTVTENGIDNATKTKKGIYVDDIELNEAIKNFIQHRKANNNKMSDYAIQLFINKLNKLSTDIHDQIELINNAIECGWKTVYPKQDKPQGKKQFSASDLTDEDFRKAGML